MWSSEQFEKRCQLEPEVVSEVALKWVKLKIKNVLKKLCDSQYGIEI